MKAKSNVDTPLPPVYRGVTLELSPVEAYALWRLFGNMTGETLKEIWNLREPTKGRMPFPVSFDSIRNINQGVYDALNAAFVAVPSTAVLE